MKDEDKALMAGLFIELVIIVTFTLLVRNAGLSWLWSTIIGVIVAVAFTHVVGLIIGEQ